MRIASFAGRFAITLLASFFLTTSLLWNAPGRDVDENWLDGGRAGMSAERQQWNSYWKFAAWYSNELIHGRAGVSSQFAAPAAELLAERAPSSMWNVGRGFAAIWLGVIGIGACGYFWPVAGRIAGGAGSLILALPSAFLILALLLAGAPAWLGLAICVWPKVQAYFAAMIEDARRRPHVVSLLAQGAGPWRVQWYGLVRPLLPQQLGLMALSLPMLLGAMIPAEAVGGEAGLGHMAWRAVAGRDLILLTTLTLWFTALTSSASLMAEYLMPEER